MADIILKDKKGNDVTYTGVKTIQVPKADGVEEFINPQGNINITDTQVTDVRGKATAQVVDENLIAENIAKGVSVLGIAGTHEGGGGEFPQLHAPTISISEDTLTITNPSNNGDFVTGYKILNNGAEVTTVTDTTVDLTAVFTEANDYTVTVKAIGTNFADSVDSNAVDYTNIYYSVTYNLTNCTSNNTATQARKNGNYIATITAESGYTMTGATASITMGGSVLSGVYANGEIVIPSVTGELVITVEAGQATRILAGEYNMVIGKTDSVDFNVNAISGWLQFAKNGGSYQIIYDGDCLKTAMAYGTKYLYIQNSHVGTKQGGMLGGYWNGQWNFMSGVTSIKIKTTYDIDVTQDDLDAFNYLFEPIL